jgi:hypothetical protein
VKPMYNALAAGKVLPNQPTTIPAPTPAQATKPVKPADKPAVPNFNARPNKDANAGQSPGMMGDRQRIARPPVPTIAAAAPTGRPQDQRSGIESAMGAAADKLHPVKRR